MLCVFTDSGNEEEEDEGVTRGEEGDMYMEDDVEGGLYPPLPTHIHKDKSGGKDKVKVSQQLPNILGT